MERDNIREFELMALRGVAALYAAHPRALDLGSNLLLAPRPHEGDADYNLRLEEAAGTARWLHRSGIVTGEIEDLGHVAAIAMAQLSAPAYLKLRAPQEDGRSLGRTAIETLASANESDAATLAAKVVAVLCKL